MDSRITHDTDYNKTQMILRDPWFQDEIRWLKKRFNEVGCPIPENGFKKAKDYHEWEKRYWDRYAEMQRSEEYKRAHQEITGGKDRISLHELNRLGEFEYNFLPPMYGECFSQILRHYKIDKKERSYFKDFIRYYIFLGIKEFPKSNFKLRWIPNNEGAYDLVIQLFGRTKKEDLLQHWKWITTFQKQLPDFIGKNKPWKFIDRDIEIYFLYKKIREANSTKRQGALAGVDLKIFAKLHRTYPELTITNIRSIVAKTKKRLGDSGA